MLDSLKYLFPKESNKESTDIQQPAYVGIGSIDSSQQVVIKHTSIEAKAPQQNNMSGGIVSRENHARKSKHGNNSDYQPGGRSTIDESDKKELEIEVEVDLNSRNYRTTSVNVKDDIIGEPGFVVCFVLFCAVFGLQ